MIRDLSIVLRFNPAGITEPLQYLSRQDALLVEEEWYWAEDKAAAFIFGSHGEAEAAAKARRYVDAEGREHEPCAVVCGNPQLEAERERRRATQAANLEAAARGEEAPRRCVSRADAQSRWQEAHDA